MINFEKLRLVAKKIRSLTAQLFLEMKKNDGEVSGGGTRRSAMLREEGDQWGQQNRKE